MKRARALYQLQSVEAEIDKKGRRLKAIDVSLRDDEAVRSAQHSVDELVQRHERLGAEIRRLELESRGFQEEITAAERKLYGGRVTNPKELASLADKIKNLKARRAKLEDDLLAVMVESEETEAGLTTGRDALVETTAKRQVDQAGLSEERAALEKDLARCREEQAALRSTISPADLAAFEDARRRKGGQGVVMVADGVCRGCGVSIPTSIARSVSEDDELVFCGSCERILCK